jgi:cytochrome c oxidase subunit 4
MKKIHEDQHAGGDLRRAMHKALGIWLLLLVLALITAGSAYIPLGAGNAAVNVAVATIKTLLVAVYFMHLREPYPVPRLACIVALVLVAILFTLSGIDYATRVPPASPPPAGPDTPRTLR